jgi:hypothetical protein
VVDLQPPQPEDDQGKEDQHDNDDRTHATSQDVKGGFVTLGDLIRFFAEKVFKHHAATMSRWLFRISVA